ncbi:MAG TPA: HemK2/MTQ2 family protein methyltransferase [Candidatus Nanoarchaeia archaeon]|nr:HemK2/MTQ2 family protein methyltransferase [Candidatus Nanoarchaeia archaeon]
MPDFSLYEPHEDSYLLAEQVKKFAQGKVLDMGCGSAIQAVTAAKLTRVQFVLAVDIQPEVITHCKKSVQHPKISFRVSDLFSHIQDKFDTIVFNPPYLPNDLRVSDIALDGGKHGPEVLERFIQDAPLHLKPRGQLLFLFSSLSKPMRVQEALKNVLLDWEEVAQKKYAFEQLFVYRAAKNLPRLILEQRDIRNIRMLTHGHRGFIVTGIWKGKKVAAKFQRSDSPAKGTVTREAKMLRMLNKNEIGPKIIASGKDYFLYRFIEGEFIEPWVAKHSAAQIRRVLRKILEQMWTLDKLGITKEEMHHPYKHLIVDKKEKPWLVDFERAHKSQRPKNVTQFCQYLRSQRMQSLLEHRGISISKKLLQQYASGYKINSRSFSDIEKLL